MLDEPMPDQVDTERFNFELSLSEDGEGYEFTTEQNIEVLRYDGELTVHFHDEEDTHGIPGEEPEDKVTSIIWDALDVEEIEPAVEQNGTVKVGRLRISTSTGSERLLVLGELVTSYTDDSQFS